MPDFTPRRRAVRATALLATTLLTSLAAAPAGAQELALKRAATRPQATACPVAPLPRQPGTAQRDEARQRANLAQEAAIVGNQRAAREQFARAAQLDPTNEEIAYQFGRTLEDAGSRPEALREYCRYIALAPASGDAADVRTRIAALAPPTPSATSVDQATPQFRVGVTNYDRARWPDAELAFGRAIAEANGWPEAYYNRALARLAQRKSAPAVADLRRYLELKPDAPDRVTVLNRVALIERPLPYTPGGALGRGVIPGFGQFYTRRPVLGTTVLAATAGAVAYALVPKRETRQDLDTTTLIDGRTVVQPIGLPYTVIERPNLTTGAALAAGITVAAAIESYIYARRVRGEVLSGEVRRAAAVRLRPLPPGDGAPTGGLALDVQLPLPRRAARR